MPPESARRWPEATPDLLAIESLLLHLGITPGYSGFSYCAYAIYLAQEDPTRLRYVTKEIYPEVARHYHTSWTCVERSIRTVLDLAWRTAPESLAALADRPLETRPCTSDFLTFASRTFIRNVP